MSIAASAEAGVGLGREPGSLAIGDAGVVIVGDVMLDVDVVGDGRRLSPEAPVPVLDRAGRVPAARRRGAGRRAGRPRHRARWC